MYSFSLSRLWWIISVVKLMLNIVKCSGLLRKIDSSYCFYDAIQLWWGTNITQHPSYAWRTFSTDRFTYSGIRTQKHLPYQWQLLSNTLHLSFFDSINIKINYSNNIMEEKVDVADECSDYQSKKEMVSIWWI